MGLVSRLTCTKLGFKSGFHGSSLLPAWKAHIHDPNAQNQKQQQKTPKKAPAEETKVFPISTSSRQNETMTIVAPPMNKSIRFIVSDRFRYSHLRTPSVINICRETKSIGGRPCIRLPLRTVLPCVELRDVTVLSAHCRAHVYTCTRFIVIAIALAIAAMPTPMPMPMPMPMRLVHDCSAVSHFHCFASTTTSKLNSRKKNPTA